MVQVSTDEATRALLVSSRALVAVAARSLADVEDVTLPQFRALVLLASHPGTTVSALADALDVHPSTATRLCDRLVRKGLVRRASAADDRRTTELHLTATGQRLVRRVTERRRRDLAAIVNRLSPAARAFVADAMAQFSDAAGEQTGVDLLGWDAAAEGA